MLFPLGGSTFFMGGVVRTVLGGDIVRMKLEKGGKEGASRCYMQLIFGSLMMMWKDCSTEGEFRRISKRKLKGNVNDRKVVVFRRVHSECERLGRVKDFRYLGSVLSENDGTYAKILERVMKTGAGALKHILRGKNVNLQLWRDLLEEIMLTLMYVGV